jgi:hypothetical protein
MTIKDFATCAALAQDSGYDGVEVTRVRVWRLTRLGALPHQFESEACAIIYFRIQFRDSGNGQRRLSHQRVPQPKDEQTT